MSAGLAPGGAGGEESCPAPPPAPDGVAHSVCSAVACGRSITQAPTFLVSGLLPSCLRPNVPSLFYSFTVLDALGLLCCTGAFSSRRVRTALGVVRGFSSRRLFLLQSMGSRHAGFSSYGPRALLPRGIWDLLRAGVEPVSPTPVGGFLATGSPGKSLISSS